MAFLSFFKAYKKFGIFFSILCVVIIAIIYNILNIKKPLPIYQPAMVSEALVDSTIQHQMKYHKIADFSLINQNGEVITQDTYKGKIYVADFFFTTCQTICPIMTDHMYHIQKEIINDDEVMLLSHSVTPNIDTVAQLKKYAKEKGVIDRKWNLVTGDKKQLNVHEKELSFTYCQVPMIYKIGDSESIEVVFNNSENQYFDNLKLNKEISTEIFNRTNKINHLKVSIVK